MSQRLTLEVSKQVFVALQRQAEIVGVSPEPFAANLLQQQCIQAVSPLLSEAEKNDARSRFERHFGTLSVDQSMSLDHESIVADLVREYATTHEQEGFVRSL